MLIGLTRSKKLPRLFLVQGISAEDTKLPAMKMVKIIWPEPFNHFESEVLDISLSGLVVPRSPTLAKVKLGQSFDLKLKLDKDSGGAGNPVPLKSRVVRQTATMIGLVFESISTEGRLVMDQADKDILVQKHLKEFSTSDLIPQLQADLWIHGPFDTNFFVWHKEDGSLKQAVVEYDHLVWIYQDGKVTLERSASTTEEARGYLAPDALFSETSTPARVLMGTSWLDRLLKLMESTVPAYSWGYRLTPLIQVLRHQRPQ